MKPFDAIKADIEIRPRYHFYAVSIDKAIGPQSTIITSNIRKNWVSACLLIFIFGQPAI
jgi:hypothetical protein